MVVWLAEGLLEYLPVAKQDHLLKMISKSQREHLQFVQDQLETKEVLEASESPTWTSAALAAPKATGRLVLPLLSPYINNLYGMRFKWIFSDIAHVCTLLQAQGWVVVRAEEHCWGTLIEAEMSV